MTVMSAQRSRTSKPFMLVGFAIGCYALSLVSGVLQTSFVHSGMGRSRTVGVGRADSIARVDGGSDIPKWQRGLDTAYFDPEASPIARIQGLSKHVTEGGTRGIAQKLMTAITILREKGPDGAQETLDVLFPKGLHLRADLDAWLDVIDKVGPPRVIAELEQLRDELRRQGVKPPQEMAEFAESISERVLPVGAEHASFRASEIFRRLPRGKADNIEYVVIYSHKDFEIRAYQPFQMASTSIEGRQDSVVDVFADSVKGEKTSVGAAFTSIVEYVQKQQGAAKVLLPIVTDYSKNEKTPTGMSLPLQVDPDANIMSDARVTYGKAQMQLCAVRKFLGVASDWEVREQYEIMRKALIADGVYDIAKDGSYSLMQYNSPFMMPWRRSNEIGIRVNVPKQV